MRSARGRDGRCRIDSREASVSRDKKKRKASAWYSYKQEQHYYNVPVTRSTPSLDELLK